MGDLRPDDSTGPDARLLIADAVEPVDPVELPDERRAGGRGTIVTLTTVIAVLVATAIHSRPAPSNPPETKPRGNCSGSPTGESVRGSSCRT